MVDRRKSGQASGRVTSHTVLLVLLFLHIMQETASQCPTFLGNYTNMTYTSEDSLSCYIIIFDEQTWEEAYKICEKSGWHMIKIDSSEESRLLDAEISNDCFWIGLTDRETEGQLRWTDGDPMTYTELTGSWLQAFDKMIYDCLNTCGYLFTKGRLWKFTDCSKTRPFICETASEKLVTAPGPPSTLKHTAPPAITTETASQCPTFLGNYTNMTYTSEDSLSCYIIIFDEQTWEEAYKICEKSGWHMIKIDSSKESRLLDAEISNDCFWIGLTDRETEGQLRWTDGDPMTYTELTGSWLQAFDKMIYDCLNTCGYLFTKGRLWKFTDCSKTRPFICETASEKLVTAPGPPSTLKHTAPPAITTVVREEVGQRNMKLLSPPEFTIESRMLSNCVRQCLRSLSSCKIIHFNKINCVCKGFSSLDVLQEDRVPQGGWEVWRIGF